MPDKFIRLSDEIAIEQLTKMAHEDIRKDGAMVAWLIRQEYSRRYEDSQPETVSAETAASGPAVRGE
jgi:hypothetical protein